MNIKSKFKYTMPIRWNDCRTISKGKEVFTVFGQQYACTSKKCKSIHCIRFQTNREANIRLVNYYYSPPDYFVVLRFENISFPLDWLMIKDFLEIFKMKLNKDAEEYFFEFEYEFLIEFDDYNYPHFHMMTKNKGNNGRQEIKSEFKKFLQEVWASSICIFKKKYEDKNEDNVEQIQKLDGITGSVYCEKVISISGAAIYLSKGQKHILKYKPVPEEWDTSKCHIVSRSRGFLVKTKKELLDIYKKNKDFFKKWKSIPLKNKQKNSKYKGTINEPVFKNEELLCKSNNNKETVVEAVSNNKTIECESNKSRTWINKILIIATWGCALIGGLVFTFNKNNFVPDKPTVHLDSKSDQSQRVKFMQKWFLDNGFEYYQIE